MNAKKIMGAVLVALLALAVFAGAGAAADAKSVGTVFVYQYTDLEGTWTGDAGSVTFINGVVEGKNIKEGVYTNTSGYSMYLCYPTAVITAIANNDSVKYPVIGGTLYKDTEWVNLTVISESVNASIWDILITTPDGVEYKGSEFFNLDTTVSSNNYFDATQGAEGILLVNLSKANLSKLNAGTYKLQAIFTPDTPNNYAYGDLVDYIPDDYRVAKDVYTITVVDADEEVTISASVDKVLSGKIFSVTVTGMPGTEYTLEVEDTGDAFEIISASGANTVNKTYNNFTMPNSGSITVYMKIVKAGDDDKVTIQVDGQEAEVTIEVLEPSLTATLSAPSYIIGETIKVTLTTDGELNSTGYYFTITGTNYDETKFSSGALIKQDADKVYNLITANLGKELDVGTYTIKVYDDKTLVATIPVALKQPLISIDDAPEVVVQGKKAEFVINAEATKNITAYIFGTNFFMNLSMNDNITVKDEKNAPNMFTVTIPAVNTTNMSAGQYFAVFQHPMYDDMFNIGVQGTDIVLNETADVYNNVYNNEHVVTLFNVDKRQTANAAQALCDNLDSQNIDDMYVKASFFVVGKDESFTISEIPTTIAQGETLTISGVSTANADGTVTVEMISTAFAAVPKETVGSAAFIAVSTKVAEDGTWEITMDTSDLNVDEYSLKVAVTPVDGKTETWKNVNINVVEADEPVNPEQPEEPEQPEQPEEPVAPATPGFGALAALAGLGAVAVLLLRRE